MNTYKEEKEEKLNNRLSNVCDSLPDYVVKFIDYKKSIGFATATLLIYAYELDQFLSFVKENNQTIDIKNINFISSIDLTMLNAYLDPKRVFHTKKGKVVKNTAANIKTKKSVLKAFMDYYYDLGYLLNNCTSMLDSAGLIPKQLTPLTDDEIIKIFDELKREEKQSAQKKKSRDLCTSRDIVIFSLLIETGISAEELIALNMEDIHMPYYQGEPDDSKRWLEIIDSYGNIRKVNFSRQVENAIRDYWGEDRTALHPLPETADAFIVSQKGTRMSVRAVQITVKKHCNNAGVYDVTPSRLKLTASSSI